MRKDIHLASRLRHRITLQQANLTAGEGGHYSIAWQDAATVWAEILPLENQVLTAESLFAEQLVARVSHEMMIRYRTDVSAEMRVAFEGRFFNIRSVVNVQEQGRILRLLVEENTAL